MELTTTIESHIQTLRCTTVNDEAKELELQQHILKQTDDLAMHAIDIDYGQALVSHMATCRMTAVSNDHGWLEVELQITFMLPAATELTENNEKLPKVSATYTKVCGSPIANPGVALDFPG